MPYSEHYYHIRRGGSTANNVVRKIIVLHEETFGNNRDPGADQEHVCSEARPCRIRSAQRTSLTWLTENNVVREITMLREKIPIPKNEMAR